MDSEMKLVSNGVEALSDLQRIERWHMDILFGIDASPATTDLAETFQRAQLADTRQLDLLTIQDHPYNRRFLDTWTLLSVLAAKTARIHVGTNVANLPLRPPVMLAKAAASLDVISGGRVELGLGAGAFWQPISALGGDVRTPGEAYAAFAEALQIIRGMWAGTSFTYDGKFYHVKGAQPGPVPAHPIRLWTGALGPRMLRLTGQMADGVLLSSSYVPASRLPEVNRAIDEGAQVANRPTEAIRRGYNVMGVILPDGSQPGVVPDGALVGTAQEWSKLLVELHETYRQDTFIFWPSGEDRLQQIERYAQEVVPAVREALQVESTGVK